MMVNFLFHSFVLYNLLWHIDALSPRLVPTQSIDHNSKQTYNQGLTYLLTYGAEPFPRSWKLCSHSGNSQQF
jgi:hypothetical protein